MSELNKNKESSEAEEERNEVTAEDIDTDDLKQAAGRFVKTAGGLAGSFGKFAVKKGSELKDKLEDEEFQNKAKNSAIGLKNKATETVAKVTDKVSERAAVQDDVVDVDFDIADSIEEEKTTFNEPKSDVIEEDGSANVETEESHRPVQKERKSNFIKEELNKRAEEKKLLRLLSGMRRSDWNRNGKMLRKALCVSLRLLIQSALSARQKRMQSSLKSSGRRRKRELQRNELLDRNKS